MQEGYGEAGQRAARRIQSLVRGVLTRERVKKMVKNLFTRRMIIKELLETEENYIRDLSIVISDFQAPLLSRKIITREDALTIFMNVDQIKRLNELFFATIFEEAREYWHYKVIFEKVEKEVHFFRLYFDYFNNYTASSSAVDRLMERRAFADFLDQARLHPHHRLLSLKDYLIKPVQRLPKYVLIMKEIKKRTPPSHPDYANIDKVLRVFQEVNESNNDKLNRVINTYKINEIEKKLSLPHTISEPGVEFVCEEPVTVITNDGAVEATLYLLNSELIVARKTGDRKEKLMVSIPFKNGGANIMTNEEHFFYKDTFTVQNGEGDSCMFLCASVEEREKLIQAIYSELMKAEQRTLEKLEALCNVRNKEGIDFLKKMTRLDMLPDVEILGTDERSDNMFKYTVYIVEIRIKVIKQKVYLRFRELLALQAELEGEYGLTIKNKLIKTPWVTNHKPRRIEERKMAIQRFLKEILSKQEVIERGEDVLLKLGLPHDFYRLPEIYKDSEDLLKKSALSQRETSEKSDCISRSIASNKRSIFASIHEIVEEQERPLVGAGRQQRRISIQDILKANELHLGHFTRYTQIMFPRKSQVEQLAIDVLIPWIENEKGFVRQRIEIERTERVVALMEQLARQIALKYFKDFRLILEREYAFRILEDDECLAKVVQEAAAGKYLLVLKKMIYVAPDIEQREIRNDRVRLKIIASQVIYDCKKDRYLLDYHLLLRLAVFIGIAQLFADQDRTPEEVRVLLREGGVATRTREMVCSSFTSFYDGLATWRQDYEEVLLGLVERVRAVSRANQRVVRTSGVVDGEREFNTTRVGQLAAGLIIASMREKPLFGAVSFVVQVSQWFREWLGKFGTEHYDSRNCWLIIKYDSLHLYSIDLTACVFSFTYDHLYKVQTYPASIFLHLRDRELDFLKLKTANSYSIREILLYYKNYNDIVRRMQEDDSFEDSIIGLVRENHREGTQPSTIRDPTFIRDNREGTFRDNLREGTLIRSVYE